MDIVNIVPRSGTCPISIATNVEIRGVWKNKQTNKQKNWADLAVTLLPLSSNIVHFKWLQNRLYWISCSTSAYDRKFDDTSSPPWTKWPLSRRPLDGIFKRIFMNEKVRILNKISPRFVPEGRINNNPALVQIMTRRRRVIIWTNADPILWRIYAALGGDEFYCWV